MSFLDSYRKKVQMPSTDEALPGRATALPTSATHFVSGHPLKGPWPEGFKQILFGMGCFWGAERLFWQVPGVYVTAVGYAGGMTPNPTYEETCTGLTGHAEVVLVVYDPKVVSLDELLTLFWEEHDPTQGMRQGNDIGTTYRSVIHTFDDADRAAVEKSRDAYGKRWQGVVSARSPRKSKMRRCSTMPRIITSNIWRKIRMDIAACAEPA